MKAYKIFGITALAATTLLAGCGSQTRQVGVAESSYSTSQEATWIEGKPVSCTSNTDKFASYAATVLEVNGKPLLATIDCDGTKDCSNVEAIIEGEIAKGKDGLVKLHGRMERDMTFTVDTLVASGYEIKY